MQIITELAIILKTIRFEDRHQIVTALTQNRGRVTVMARNSIQSRRFGFSLQPLVASEWTLREKEAQDLSSLESAELKRDFKRIRENYDAFAIAGVLSDWILRIAPEKQPADDLFRMHSNALAYLEELADQTPFPKYEILSSYFLKSLVWMGLKPKLHQCLECHRSVLEVEQAFGVIDRPGWRCEKCAHGKGHPLTLTALQSAVSFIDAPIRQTLERTLGESEDFEAFFRYVHEIVQYHVPGVAEHPLKSLGLLTEMGT